MTRTSSAPRVRTDSASRRISRSNSTVVGCVADSWQNQPGLRFGERFVSDEIHAAVEKFFQPFVQCEEIVISALRVVELDIHIHIAVVTFLAACKRAEYAEPARTECEQFRKMSFDDRQRIRRRGQKGKEELRAASNIEPKNSGDSLAVPANPDRPLLLEITGGPPAPV